MKLYCDENGNQTDANMSAAAQRGRLKIAKLVREKKVVVMPSDKGKGICVMEWGMYEESEDVSGKGGCVRKVVMC